MTGIYVEQSGLEWAVRQGLLSPAQAAALWPALVARSAQGRPNPGGRNLVQVAVYTGSLLVISALTWLLQFASASGACLFVLALAYVVVFGAVGSKLWFDGQARYGIPQAVGGLFVTYAVSVAPVATSAATQGYLDQWPMSKDILTGLTLVAGGACALHIGGIRFPLLTAPIAVGLYCMAVADVAQVAWDVPHAVIRPTINVIVVGVAMNVVGYAIDRRTRPVQDFGFWFYFIGTVSTLEGLVFLLKSPEDLLGPYYCGVVVFLVIYIVAGALMNRQGLVALGSLGACAYATYLSDTLFWRSWSYPLALAAVGLPVVFFGVRVHKYITNQTSVAIEAAQLDGDELQASNAKEA